jgi:hypothetical protein
MIKPKPIPLEHIVHSNTYHLALEDRVLACGGKPRYQHRTDTTVVNWLSGNTRHCARCWRSKAKEHLTQAYEREIQEAYANRADFTFRILLDTAHGTAIRDDEQRDMDKLREKANELKRGRFYGSSIHTQQFPANDIARRATADGHRAFITEHTINAPHDEAKHTVYLVVVREGK